MPDPSVTADSKERGQLATFRITEDEVALLALIRRFKRDEQHRTYRVSLEVDASGIILLEQNFYMRKAIA